MTPPGSATTGGSGPGDPDRARIVDDLTAIPGVTRMRFTRETPGFSSEQQEGVLAGWQTLLDELERVAAAGDARRPRGPAGRRATSDIEGSLRRRGRGIR